VKRFFLRGTGGQAGFVRVRPELRAMVTFRQVNLLSDVWSIRGPLDAIFCRNVMIYFDKETQLKILQRFAPLLQPEMARLRRAFGKFLQCHALVQVARQDSV